MVNSYSNSNGANQALACNSPAAPAVRVQR
jgi:hypothetical protein